MIPRCGPRYGSAVRILGKGFSPNVEKTNSLQIKWGVFTTRKIKKLSVTYFLYKKQAGNSQMEKITHAQLA